MKKLVSIFFILSMLIPLSCSMHKFVNKDINPKSKAAVIIAETKFPDVNELYANNLTDGLAAKSKLTVIPQSKVKAILGSYPQRIKGPYKLMGMDAPKIDYALHDMDKLAAIAKKLNVQYLYVFWIPISKNMIQGGTEIVDYYYIGELVEFPSKRIIAHVEIDMAYVKEGATNGPKNVKEMCGWYSEAAVKDIIDNTGIGK